VIPLSAFVSTTRIWEALVQTEAYRRIGVNVYRKSADYATTVV
jgi:hypothetical protein